MRVIFDRFVALCQVCNGERGRRRAGVEETRGGSRVRRQEESGSEGEKCELARWREGGEGDDGERRGGGERVRERERSGWGIRKWSSQIEREVCVEWCQSI